ncbi:MAG: carboxymuconolactone decarboxylase family protein [Mycobacterium sp.]|uniref:carboxymuconolactone decarboxylase family protein n=1 Tax=Mycobacterium sp. TaxID=1785 RepID=UPI003BB74C12
MTGADDETDQVGRIPAGGFRELGPINWILAKSAARTVRAPKMHLFATLGQHKRLFLAMMPYSAVLLRGRLPLIDTELVILRVAHLRRSEYELQHHRWMGRRRGLDEQTQELIFAWPDTPADSLGLTDRQQALLRATDEFILNRTLSTDVWQQLSHHLDRRQLIEFCMLAGQYDGLAATMSALKIPLDHPGSGRSQVHTDQHGQ